MLYGFVHLPEQEQPTLDLTPYLELTNWRTESVLADRATVRLPSGELARMSRRTWRRLLCQLAVGPWLADRLAAGLGLLPDDIWPDFHDALDEAIEQEMTQ